MYDEHGEHLSAEEAYRLTDEYKGLQAEVRRLQPMRIGVFKRYWARFKYNRNKREQLMEMFDAADQQAEFYYGEGFTSWRDEIEGVHEFLEELRTKKREAEAKSHVKGNTIVKTIKGEILDRDTQEIEYSSATFNPFSAENRRTQETDIQKVLKENDAVTQSTRGGGRASHLQSRLTARAKDDIPSGGLTIGSTSASTATEGDSTVSSSELGTDGLSSDSEAQRRRDTKPRKGKN